MKETTLHFVLSLYFKISERPKISDKNIYISLVTFVDRDTVHHTFSLLGVVFKGTLHLNLHLGGVQLLRGLQLLLQDLQVVQTHFDFSFQWFF